jgi:hypothetical protein
LVQHDRLPRLYDETNVKAQASTFAADICVKSRLGRYLTQKSSVDKKYNPSTELSLLWSQAILLNSSK